MKKLSNSSIAFYAYVGTNKKFYGDEVLSTIAFLTMYLNYDTYCNVLRKELISLITNAQDRKVQQSINSRALEFIVCHKEPAAKFAKAEYLSKKVVTSDLLEEALQGCSESPDINQFMYNLYFAGANAKVTAITRAFLNDVFGIDFFKLKSRIEETLSKLHESVDESNLLIEEKLQPYLSFVDGRRENYKLNTRKDIISVVWMTMEKRKRTNILLMGDIATGKTGIINSLAYQIAHKTCNPMFYDNIVIKLSLIELFSGDLDRGEISKKISEIVEGILRFQERVNRRLIVFIDDFYCAFAQQETGLYYYYSFMPLYNADDISVIVGVAAAETETFQKNPNISKSFVCVVAEEPEKRELHESIKPSTYPLIIHHGVNITDEWIEMSILYTKALNIGESIILGSLDLLDVSMANAMLKNRTSITKEDMLEYYLPEFNMYEEQSEEIKRLTAYHEAGHFVVSRFCKHYTAVYADLITIIPSDDAGGFNRFEYDASKLKDYGYEFYLEGIACSLGGRASEEIFIGSISSGAESDLKSATDTATSMISILGLDNQGKKLGFLTDITNLFIKKNEFAIKGNENLKSEKSLNSVSEKVNVLMDRAYKHAVKQLQRHEDYINVLVEILLREKIVSRDDIIRREYKGHDGIIRLKAD